MYEENPYPRWATAGRAMPEDFAAWLQRKFPAATEAPRGAIEILVAGCGTGRNAIETAQMFSGSRVLAIDLSRASLAYAMRKRGSLPIEFAQADILALESLERRFDLIEAVGVLHHMADPFAGWRVLLGLLKPGGVMKLGFYSDVARRDLPRLEATTGADGIRAARPGQAQQHPALIERPDFYTTSTCRDLLYHVQEIRLDLERIRDFLRAQNLNMLGFALDDSVLVRYRARFPADTAAIDLQNWQVFEDENPATFAGMYEFFVQRAP
jgi:2-polyprenyl-3-methyl-5-hydroxy-6-metoxy-1,4-benzoquinol methylase